ncbi:MAG: ribosome small subunit-dependent GTPase A [Clostridiales bacterium]|jgi:ribosome biogenesis GTPase|nr:ribosome small subunit-dependent GTPase A [Clostridiales bacterium]
MIEGRVTKGIGGFYYVATERGLAECRARGRLRRERITPAVGDWAAISIVNETPLQGALEEIRERTNFLIRPPVANVDNVVVVIAAASPNPDYFMVDKLIVTAERAGIRVIVAVNKTDLALPDEIVSTYADAGYPSIAVCAGRDEGTDALRDLIAGGVTAFAGNSGVGKSSILNRLGFALETGAVSKIARGKHTTRHAELLRLEPEGYVIDTPGFSLLEINGVKAGELRTHFREFARLGDCRFPGCAHVGAKAEDCAVIAAVRRGELRETRYQSYVTLYNSLKAVKEWEQ